MRMTRRRFLKNASCAAASLAAAHVQVIGAETSPADLLFKNGSILTMEDSPAAVEALAVRGGRIQAAGTLQEVSRLAGERTRTIDLGGRSLTPGLIDAHSHPMGFGHMELHFVLVRPPKVHNFETLGRTLAQAAAKLPRGEWVVARGFEDFDEGRYPTRQELDRYVPQHPMLAIQWSGQYGICNTLALQKADLLRRDAADPYGGKYLRDRSTGIPDGRLLHYPAIYSIHKTEMDEAGQVESIRWALDKFLACGVTCIHDNFATGPSARSYAMLDRMGRLSVRMRVYPYVSNLRICQELLQRMRPYQGSMAKLSGVKLAVDGYALMYDVPPEHRELDMPMHPQDQFEAIVAAIHRADLQVDVHAVGDKGVDWTLKAFAKAAGSAQAVRRLRHRIEHYPFLKADSIRHTADLGVPVCTQPAILYLRAESFLKRFGTKKLRQIETMVPLRTMTRAGVRVCFGADVPAFPSYLPLDSVRCALDRRTSKGRALDTNESVPFLQALKMHTIESAYAAFDEGELGSLKVGKLADMVVWNKDLRTVRSVRELSGLEVQTTYVGGKEAYAKKA